MKILLAVIGIFTCCLIKSQADEVTIEQKLNMTTVELIRTEGYYVEEYKVITSDDYILLLHRIPYGKEGPTTQKKIPVFVIHGIACESTVWVDQGERSLAFLLANEGYDVWLGNMRGNRNSAHTKYSRNDPRFYNFSIDEHIKYDLPAMWDFVLQKTGASKIYNVGLSLGSLSTLANLANSEEYHSKFIGFFGMGPVSRLTYSTDEQFRVISVAVPLINTVENFILKPFFDKPEKLSCSPNCSDEQILTNKHCNSGTSFRAALHAAQLILSKNLSHFDYGNPAENFFHYSSIKPPQYDLTKIQIPISLYSACNDYLANPLDVTRLKRDLRNVIHHRIINKDLFDHSDFLRYPTVDEEVYKPIISDMKELN